MLTTFKIKKLTMLVAAVSLGLNSFTHAQDATLSQLSIEELRIDKAFESIPNITSRLKTRVNEFSEQVTKANDYTVLMQLTSRHASGLWRDAKQSFNQRIMTTDHYIGRVYN